MNNASADRAPSYIILFCTCDTCRRYVNDGARLNKRCMRIKASVHWQGSPMFLFIYLFVYMFTFATSLPKDCTKSDTGSSSQTFICIFLNTFVGKSILAVFNQQAMNFGVILLILYIWSYFCFDFCANILSAYSRLYGKESKEMHDNKSFCFI